MWNCVTVLYRAKLALMASSRVQLPIYNEDPMAHDETKKTDHGGIVRSEDHHRHHHYLIIITIHIMLCHHIMSSGSDVIIFFMLMMKMKT